MSREDGSVGERMRAVHDIMILLAVTLVAGCSRFTVETRYDPMARFTALRTYAWRPGPPLETGDPRIDDAVLDQRLRSAIERVLAKKGFRPAAEGKKPDFLVGYYVALHQETRTRTSNQLFGSDGQASPRPDTYPYEEGTLQIDIVNTANSKLLWRGAGIGVVDPSASPDTRKKRINAAVAQILSKFPPKTGASISAVGTGWGERPTHLV